jgi:hypothetical protein
MPWDGTTYHSKWDWEREAPRAEHIYNARLQDELNDSASAITLLKAQIDAGGGGGGGGIPEAPADGLSYGRLNFTWVRVLAMANDVLDGGNF